MRGSVRKRPSGYTIVYDAGMKWNPKKEQWVRNQKWEKVPQNTRKAAEKLLTRRLHEIQEGVFIDAPKVTFGAFKDIWMEKYGEGEASIRPSTLAQYRSLFKNHLIPAFGGVELSRIRQEAIQSFKARLLKSGKEVEKDGEIVVTGLSPQTVKHALRLMRQILDHAVEWGYLRNNPARKVRDPKIPRKEMDFLTPEELALLFEKVPTKWYPFFLTAVVSGLRIGEMLAMKWGNLDWNRGQYFVKETWQRGREGRPATIAEPKTESSRAAVDLTPSCLRALRTHRTNQAEEKLAAGKEYVDQDLIFPTSTSGMMDDRNVVHRVFHPALAEAGIRRVRFHDLRHTTAALLIDQGESPKYIQKQLRHASIDITFDRYGHLFPETNREAARRMDEALFGPSALTAVR